MNHRVTAVAHPNLAFVKYWGKVDERINLPANSSISVNLGGARTITSVTFSSDQNADVVRINGQEAAPKAYERVVRHIDRVRSLADLNERALVESENDFPASAGIASSASAFASLSLAATKAAGLDLDEKSLSVLARKGSGSACRSIPDGFVEWKSGTDSDTSFAYQIAPPDYWDIKITTVVLDNRPKDISSSEGHKAAKSSPFYQARIDTLPKTLKIIKRSLLNRDFRSFGRSVEKEAISMHVIAMTADVGNKNWLSGIYYWQPETLKLIQSVQEWRQDGLEVYLTIDAGPNVHLICEGKDQSDLEQELKQISPYLGSNYLVSEPSKGAWVIEEPS